MAIATAAFPKMMEKKKESLAEYHNYIREMYGLLMWFSFVVAVVVFFLAPVVVPFLYGPTFMDAASILTVQIWAGITVAMSFIHGKWLLAEGLQKYALVYTIAGGVINVLANFLLIPKYGALGSAWATLITQIGLLPLQLIFKKTRINFFMMIQGLNAPYRILVRKLN